MYYSPELVCLYTLDIALWCGPRIASLLLHVGDEQLCIIHRAADGQLF